MGTVQPAADHWTQVTVNTLKLERARLRTVVAQQLRLRDELAQQLRQDDTEHADSPDADMQTQTEVFRFLDLPKDIRLLIYEDLVAPGTITLQYSRESARRDARYTNINEASYAETQIVLVSKQLKDEALPLYLSKNLFLWPVAGYGWARLFDDTEAEVYGGMARRYLRRLSIAFDFAEMDTAFITTNLIHGPKSVWTARDPPLNGIERMQYCHGFETGALLHAWEPMSASLATYSKLNRLQVNVRNTYRTRGCCRLLPTILVSCFVDAGWATRLRCYSSLARGMMRRGESWKVWRTFLGVERRRCALGDRKAYAAVAIAIWTLGEHGTQRAWH